MFIRIEPGSGLPITRQIMDQIRAQCASGVLAPGQRLPSIRELARRLAVNQNTILHVYERLTAEGLLERLHGDGTYVSNSLPAGRMKAQRSALASQAQALARQAVALGVEPDALLDLVRKSFEDCRRDAGRHEENADE